MKKSNDMCRNGYLNFRYSMQPKSTNTGSVLYLIGKDIEIKINFISILISCKFFNVIAVHQVIQSSEFWFLEPFCLIEKYILV